MRFIRDERRPNQAHLLPHGRGRRTAHRRARTDDGVDIERRDNIGAEQGARLLKYGKGQIVEPTSALLAYKHQAPDNLMRLTERHALLGEVVGDIRRREMPDLAGCAHRHRR